jgi:predicted enzyme related to lactoylglutathione lyase
VAAIGWAPEEQDGRAPAWSTYVAVANADHTAIAAVEAGGDVLVPAADIGDAGRMAVLADPTGAVFCIWQATDFIGAEAVNEPGTWNWSVLASRDPHASMAFYNAVFGWQASDPGNDEAALVRLPGYGDFLATIDPGLRERHAAPGIPPGFSDAVALIEPLTDESGPRPVYSHWSVVFAVDDAAAAAARAESLGGAIVEPPRATGPVVQALVADPAGARFTLSAYTPA